MTSAESEKAIPLRPATAGRLLFAITAISALMLGAQTLQAATHVLAPESSGEVLSHLPFDGSHVSWMTLGEVKGKTELFLFEPSQGRVAIVNATRAEKPVKEGDYKTAEGTQPVALHLLSNGQLLVSTVPSGESRIRPASPVSLTLVNLRNPREPSARQEFKNILAYFADESTGLLYLVTPEGLTIVRVPSLMSPGAQAWNQFADAR